MYKYRRIFICVIAVVLVLSLVVPMATNDYAAS